MNVIGNGKYGKYVLKTDVQTHFHLQTKFHPNKFFITNLEIYSQTLAQSLTSRGRGRGRGSSSGGNQNSSYSLASQKDQESSPDVVTDPASTLSCITPFVVGKFVCGRQTSADLVELEMLDFDAIMGMDWLAACYATVHCRATTARFHFLGEPVLEWVGNTATPRGRFISYLKAMKMFAKGCIYHIVRVRDADAEIPTLQSIPVVKEYADVFLDELPAYLGHIVCDGDIKVYTQKIEDVKSWPRPTTPTEKATKFQWTEDCKKSFQELKNRLNSGPVLTLPEGQDGYAMYCDASGVELGCVMM
ncbi:uncharacterized protein [Nicotiana tomentosiformis]|uniref:uncharacterized protein n=1 Tax=Nicotiana tomentosiformis TaxID=4098 RepID=UPI00388C3785